MQTPACDPDLEGLPRCPWLSRKAGGGLTQEGDGDGEAPLHAAAVGGCRQVLRLCQLDLRQEPVRLRCHLLPRNALPELTQTSSEPCFANEQ